MTTESKQDTRPLRSLRAFPLLGAATAGVVLVVLLGLLGLALDGGPGVLGALVGGGLALLVLGTGTAVVHLVANVMPTASLLVALLTYTLQVVLMLVVALALSRSGLVGDELSAGWFAGGIIAVTIGWMVVQVGLVSRQRIPVYDLPPAEGSADASDGLPGGER